MNAGVSDVQRAPHGLGLAHEVCDVLLEQRSIMGEDHVGDDEDINPAWTKPVARFDLAAMVLVLLSSARCVEVISHRTGQS